MVVATVATRHSFTFPGRIALALSDLRTKSRTDKTHCSNMRAVADSSLGASDIATAARSTCLFLILRAGTKSSRHGCPGLIASTVLRPKVASLAFAVLVLPRKHGRRGAGGSGEGRALLSASTSASSLERRPQIGNIVRKNGALVVDIRPLEVRAPPLSGRVGTRQHVVSYHRPSHRPCLFARGLGLRSTSDAEILLMSRP